ncbi:7687_t:CDS:2 [Funneliformis geosporum]|uniref:7687_t:CDS:1 n=1 Tax=Funneliformis geosporum TaxID=1117311 RepID=A0A9W4SSL6_9GLOM|nr:7687_t:CDS:2 [Funneliformis geosporum]
MRSLKSILVSVKIKALEERLDDIDNLLAKKSRNNKHKTADN